METKSTAKQAVTTITASDIEYAAIMDDVDDACGALQDIAAITDGDIAAICFSGFEWSTATVSEREAKLRDWLKTETAYATGGPI